MPKVRGIPLDHKPYLLKAIKLCRSSQAVLGELSALSRQKINYLLNRGKTVKYEDARAIERATNHQVKWHQLACGVSDDFKKEVMQENHTLDKMSLSDRVELGLRYEAELKTRSGVKGRIESIAAGLIHFGNYQTYRQAKKVKLHGIPELVTAMDLKKFRIFPLSRIADYPPEEQQYLLSLKLREMKAWMKTHPVMSKPSNWQIFDCDGCKTALPINTIWISLRDLFIPQKSCTHLLKVIRTVLTDSALKQAEKNSHLPLRLFFLSLLCHADEHGRCLETDLEEIGKYLLVNDRDRHTAIQQLLNVGKVQLSPNIGESS